MFKKTLLAIALPTLAFAASAHQVWVVKDAQGPARVYVGDVDDAHDRGEEVAKLAATTQVFTTDPKQPAKVSVKDDHLEAAVGATGDVRLVNDAVWKPWKLKDGRTKVAIFNSRAGRTETRAVLDYEIVPVVANGNAFTVTYKGQPLAGKAVTVITPDKWSKHFKTDAAGRLEVPVREKGRYVLMSVHDADAVGDAVFAGEKVQQLGYTTTLSFIAP
ncbi:hypothetical protein BH09PSE5_BH09PSE5_18050 [soil metagenome]